MHNKFVGLHNFQIDEVTDIWDGSIEGITIQIPKRFQIQLEMQ